MIENVTARLINFDWLSLCRMVSSPALPVCSNFFLKALWVCTVCRQSNHVGLCVLSSSILWIIECRVQSDPEHHPVRLMHGQACVSTHCLRARSYTLITGSTGRGGRAAGLLCSHDCAVLWHKEWEMRARERVGALMQSKESKAEERSCKYRKLHAEESGWQIGSRQWVGPKRWLLTQQSTDGSG